MYVHKPSGQSSYWQDCFIKQNLILLAHTANRGYLGHGRGIVLCQITETIPRTINWQLEQVSFTQQFIPQAQATSYFEKVNLAWEIIITLNEAIATYDPTREIILAIQKNSHVEVHYLRPKIPLGEAYEQVQRRWSEFYLENPIPKGRNE
ncbi:MAG: hypothetical protein EA366_07385 [Spirulina sp. DLM2.Bin59]|nr:MAG: hypothetical protein EA366_07385 [Spirulina sp. DLM2.Bin59]